MAIFHGNAIPSAVAAGYDIPYSCRFDAAGSPYMHWTPGGAGDSTEFTISFWYKISSVGDSITRRTLFSAGPVVNNEFVIGHAYNGAGDQFNVQMYISGSANAELATNRKLRDPSGWYHIVVAVDTSAGAAADKCKLYINGELQTSFAADGRSSMGSSQLVNSAVRHEVGRFARVGGHYMDGYIAEFHSVDGTQLDADSFGESGDYGEWKPIKYTGSHGTNGFYLDFADSGDLGDDESANTNDFTEVNLAAHDQMTDTPTNNFCTMNPINNVPNACTFAEGNLKVTDGGDGSGCWSNFGMNSGKWYCEVHIVSDAADPSAMIGISGSQPQPTLATELGSYPDDYIMGSGVGGANPHNRVRTNDTPTAYANLSTGAGETIGMALDLENNKMYWRADGGTWINSADPAAGSGGWPTSGYIIAPYSGHYHFAVGRWNPGDNVYVMNFGQDGTFAGNETAAGNADDNGYGNFLYDVPAGFLALCTKNIPDCAVIPSEHFGVMLTTIGAGARTFASHGIPAGAKFAPEMIWLKSRATTHNHHLCDVIQGVEKSLQPNVGDIQATGETTGLTSFDADGFTLGNDGSYAQTSGDGMVYWNWKLGGTPTADNSAGAGATPTANSVKIDGANLGSALAGSIAVTKLSANTTAGISVGIWNGSGANATIAHGLTKAPNLVVVHALDYADSWPVGSHQPLYSGAFNDYLRRDSTAAFTVGHNMWNQTAPTTTVITVGSDNATNKSSTIWRFEAYHDVDGYSKIGCYKGNGNDDGTFVYTGFRPRYVIVKVLSATDSWQVMDTGRDPYNVANKRIRPDSNAAENLASWTNVDFLSNGFKPRGTDTIWNHASHYYLYMAFAETPFKNANAR